MIPWTVVALMFAVAIPCAFVLGALAVIALGATEKEIA